MVLFSVPIPSATYPKSTKGDEISQSLKVLKLFPPALQGTVVLPSCTAGLVSIHKCSVNSGQQFLKENWKSIFLYLCDSDTQLSVRV